MGGFPTISCKILLVFVSLDVMKARKKIRTRIEAMGGFLPQVPGQPGLNGSAHLAAVGFPGRHVEVPVDSDWIFPASDGQRGP